MAKVELSLEQQHDDEKSNQVIIRFNIRNNGQYPIEIVSLTTQVPIDAVVIRSGDQTVEGERLRKERLLRQINYAANEFLFTFNEDFRKKYTEANRESIRESFGLISGAIFFNFVLIGEKLMSTFSGEKPESAQIQLSASVNLSTLSDCDLFYDGFIRGDQNKNSSIARIINFLIQQIKLIDVGILENKNSGRGTIIDQESQIELTYVVRFKRQYLSRANYNFDIEMAYSEIAEGVEKLPMNRVCSTSIFIPPHPLPLSIFAGFSPHFSPGRSVEVTRGSMRGPMCCRA